ncbi:hypothetical protein [Ruminococcus sp. XPD3002]|uniref:hypothetical protein n=1 Tax=Ruminococcus sp. XPD3002 TaxID=1452269 RepID=UPI00090FDE05|nr:hypothetical protein SAMN04487832_11762 [Ruminococcus flavefaciens]
MNNTQFIALTAEEMFNLEGGMILFPFYPKKPSGGSSKPSKGIYWPLIILA